MHALRTIHRDNTPSATAPPKEVLECRDCDVVFCYYYQTQTLKQVLLLKGLDPAMHKHIRG